MRVTLHSTTKIVTINGVEPRIWEGHTDSGIACHAYISRIACEKHADAKEFEADLQEHDPPSAALDAIPLRLVL
jgi:hypothetical protein